MATLSQSIAIPVGAVKQFGEYDPIYEALKALPWFPTAVRDVRAFRLEMWSDFKPMMKS